MSATGLIIWRNLKKIESKYLKKSKFKAKFDYDPDNYIIIK